MLYVGLFLRRRLITVRYRRLIFISWDEMHGIACALDSALPALDRAYDIVGSRLIN